MPIYNRIADFQDDLIATRRDIHENPELGFEENRTSDLVAKQLESWGIEVHRGIAKTGLVGVLRGNGDSSRSIGIRADMDALPMSEEGNPTYKSKNDGKMHACGHDGHTTMLLGAARYLAETKNFDGTVNFIFQPAEEGGGGGRIMVEEGVFDRFQCDTVWGMHNDPKLPAGTIATRPGPLMAAVDTVKIIINAVGCHAAMPHVGIDPIAVAVQLYTAMQTIVARNVDPIKSAVVSVTMFHAGSASNVIASSAELVASIRTFDPEIRKLIEDRTSEICKGMETAHNVNIDIDYDNGYPATINHVKEAAEAIDIAKEIVDESMIDDNIAPVMGGEDFSYMLEARPGAFLWIGGGKTDNDPGLHHPEYDFNDEVLTLGSSYWAKLVETRLSKVN
tara:strand:- start:802 stop:1977 length:1176 start_codon:yes stop_codon:yes gene_type:complete